MEDSLVVGTTEESQLTELSPVPQLHIPDATNIYCHNNSQEYDSCKVTQPPRRQCLMPVFLNKTDPREYFGRHYKVISQDWKSSINLFKSIKDKS